MIRTLIEFSLLVASGLLVANIVVHSSEYRFGLLLFGSFGMYFVDRRLRNLGRRSGIALLVVASGVFSLIACLFIEGIGVAITRLLWLDGPGTTALNIPYAFLFGGLIFGLSLVVKPGMPLRNGSKWHKS